MVKHVEGIGDIQIKDQKADMKILDQAQLYEADRQTIATQGITSTGLMERAAVAVFNWLHNRLQGAPVPIHIFCGIGNNGGDGLAVARHLTEHGYHIKVYIVHYSEKRSDDFLGNLERLKDRKVWPETLNETSELPLIPPTDVIIDAVFGIGLSRPPAPWVRSLFNALNASGAFILSIDVPSGLYLEGIPEQVDGAVRASHVLTIGAPKLVFFLPQTGPFTGSFEVVDIGFDPEYLASVEAAYELVSKADAARLYRPRPKFAHKGDMGHARMIGGSYGKIGAVALAARACLYSGAGLVTAWVPGCGYMPLQSQIPELMVQIGEGERILSEFPLDADGYTTGIGMGLGTEAATATAYYAWLKKQTVPMVVDADALNLLSSNPAALQDLPEGSILTPHPGELKRLIGTWKDDFEKLEKAHAFANTHKCILLIKGAHTVILHKGRGYVNSSGNPGMATAGSGDVLCGMLTGLLAQGYKPLQAAIFGVYLHGRAGDLMAAEYGYEALTAGRIAEGIGRAIIDLFHQPGADESGTKKPSEGEG